jgi:diacylglycerol kinase family enzyme
VSTPQQPAEVDPASVGPRLAALAAIALELAAALLAVFAFFARPGVVLLSVLAVGVSVYGLILLLLRKGAVRWLGALVLLLGVTGAVLLLFAGNLIVVLAVIFLLSALSAAAATFALRPHPYRPPERPVPPPAKPFFLMNRWSGGGKVGQFKLDEQARSLGAEVVMLEHGMDIVETVESAVKDGADLLGAAGGDGTQALVAEVAARRDLPMVVVPAGTRNHFARDLGLDRDDPRAAIAALGAGGVEIRIDLGRVADRPFVNNVSLGVYAAVISSPEYRDAKLTTALKALPDSAGLDADSGLRVQTPDGRVHVDPEVVQIGNNQYEYRNVRTSGTRPRLDTGQLGIELIDYDSRSELERVITGVASGHVAGAERDGLLARWTAESLTVESSSGVVHAGVDGEYLTLPSPLIMSCQAGALRVRVPADRPGLPAPLPTSSVATLRALWSVARGRPA